MQVTINIVNEMRKLRTNTYQNKYAWIEELMQNAQRAGAKHVDVTIENDCITISDDGCGCNDPKMLFEKSSSGWSDTIMQNESPFGEGFFSTMLAANRITVKSIGFNAVFDVKKMFEQNDPDVIEITPNSKTSGFKVILEDLEDIYMWNVEETFKKVARFIKTPTTSINGVHVKYKGLDPDTDSPFVRKVKTPHMRGWIIPHRWSDDYIDSYIETFYSDRKVKDLKIFEGVSGIISFENNVIDLRCPDRKDFVQNEKYEVIKAELHTEIAKMYGKLLKEASDNIIERYESYIEKYLDMNEYKKHIRFKFIKNEKEPEIDPASNNDTTDNDDAFENNMCGIDSAATPTTTDFVIKTTSAPVTAPVATDIPEKKKIGRPKSISMQTGYMIDDLKYAFYVEPHHVTDYQDQIKLAQHYHIPVIEIRNKLEKNICTDDDRLHPISDIINLIELRASYTNIVPNSMQETRALKLLSKLSEAMGWDTDLFRIADTDFRKVICVDSENEQVIEVIDKIASAYNGKIYINRQHMKAYSDLIDSPVLTYADVRFIMMNLEVFAREAAHAIYDTVDTTMQHEQKTIELMTKITNTVYRNKIGMTEATA